VAAETAGPRHIRLHLARTVPATAVKFQNLARNTLIVCVLYWNTIRIDPRNIGNLGAELLSLLVVFQLQFAGSIFLVAADLQFLGCFFTCSLDELDILCILELTDVTVSQAKRSSKC
jgi:hypothetical protein